MSLQTIVTPCNGHGNLCLCVRLHGKYEGYKAILVLKVFIGCNQCSPIYTLPTILFL